MLSRLYRAAAANPKLGIAAISTLACDDARTHPAIKMLTDRVHELGGTMNLNSSTPGAFVPEKVDALIATRKGVLDLKGTRGVIHLSHTDCAAHKAVLTLTPFALASFFPALKPLSHEELGGMHHAKEDPEAYTLHGQGAYVRRLEEHTGTDVLPLHWEVKSNTLLINKDGVLYAVCTIDPKTQEVTTLEAAGVLDEWLEKRIAEEQALAEENAKSGFML